MALSSLFCTPSLALMITCLFLITTSSTAFLPLTHHYHTTAATGGTNGIVAAPPPSLHQLWAATKKKKKKKTGGGGGGGLSQKRAKAREQRRLAIEESVATLPKSKLDFKTPPPKPTPTTVAQPPPDSEGTAVDPNDETQSKAKELVDAQRESVQMLTHVTQQIESKIPVEELTEALFASDKGYYVVDDFLKEEVVAQLQSESESLYENDEMTTDTAALGTGEFIIGIEGGTDQYPKCPRSIEWVVSVTSKLAATLNSNDDDDSQQQQQQQLLPELDDRACSQARGRLFDRSSLKASLQLLLGIGNNENDSDKTKMEDALANMTPPPFQTIIDDSNNNEEEGEGAVVDLRKVSVSYYLVPENWDTSCGGHLSFLQATDCGSPTVVEAKRNRLVIWKSDSTQVRREPFRGNDDITTASGLELHLVEKQQQQLQ